MENASRSCRVLCIIHFAVWSFRIQWYIKLYIYIYMFQLFMVKIFEIVDPNIFTDIRHFIILYNSDILNCKIVMWFSPKLLTNHCLIILYHAQKHLILDLSTQETDSITLSGVLSMAIYPSLSTLSHFYYLEYRAEILWTHFMGLHILYIINGHHSENKKIIFLLFWSSLELLWAWKCQKSQQVCWKCLLHTRQLNELQNR